jgi:hypothetical protein
MDGQYEAGCLEEVCGSVRFFSSLSKGGSSFTDDAIVREALTACRVTNQEARSQAPKGSHAKIALGYGFILEIIKRTCYGPITKRNLDPRVTALSARLGWEFCGRKGEYCEPEGSDVSQAQKDHLIRIGDVKFHVRDKDGKV